MDAIGILRKALSGFDCEIVPAKVPDVTVESVLRNRTVCERDDCNCYGRSWSCPPGVCRPDECVDIVASYGNACLISKRYEVEDSWSKDCFKDCRLSFQDMCRRGKHALEDAGFGVTVLSDGKCDFCDDCAYPEPCRHPGEVLPSVSAMGIDMESYMSSMGMGFSFDDHVITLYGIVLVRAG